MRYESFDWYQAPRYYDAIFDTSTDAEARFIEAAYRLHAKGRPFDPPRALEPACGTGRLLEAMQQRGFQVAGFDPSEAMLRAARERDQALHLSAQAMQSFSYARRFDLVFNLLSSFKYLLDDGQALAHLRRVADVLRVGGIYLLGLHLSDYDDVRRTRERWTAELAEGQLVCNLQRGPADPLTRLEPARARLIVTKLDGTRRFETKWQFRCYDEAELRALLAGENRLELVAGYGFDHNVARPHELDCERLDHVLVLRRCGAPRPQRQRL